MTEKEFDMGGRVPPSAPVDMFTRRLKTRAYSTNESTPKTRDSVCEVSFYISVFSILISVVAIVLTIMAQSMQ